MNNHSCKLILSWIFCIKTLAALLQLLTRATVSRVALACHDRSSLVAGSSALHNLPLSAAAPARNSRFFLAYLHGLAHAEREFWACGQRRGSARRLRRGCTTSDPLQFFYIAESISAAVPLERRGANIHFRHSKHQLEEARFV